MSVSKFFNEFNLLPDYDDDDDCYYCVFEFALNK